MVPEGRRRELVDCRAVDAAASPIDESDARKVILSARDL